MFWLIAYNSKIVAKYKGLTQEQIDKKIRDLFPQARAIEVDEAVYNYMCAGMSYR